MIAFLPEVIISKLKKRRFFYAARQINGIPLLLSYVNVSDRQTDR